jgi:oxygen-dependent protoporphyrinogen oxidase
VPIPGKPRIAIIGGGISGVAAAYALSQRHPDQPFTLFEASSRLGGIVETVHEHGFTIECGPDSWVTEKPWARELAEELGLADEILPSNDFQRRTYIARGRELIPMPDGMRMMVPTRWEPLLHSPLLSWQARLAYLREPKRAEELKQTSLAKRGAKVDESVSDFVLRHFGEEVARTLAGPLLSGVFGGDIEKLSVRSVMAPFVRMEADHGSLIEALRLRSPGRSPADAAATFTTLRSGLETLIKGMVEHLPSSSIFPDMPVTELSKTAKGWQVSTRARGPETFDAVLLAAPAHVTRMLLQSIQNELAENVATLLPTHASSSVVVALGFHEKASRLRIPRGFGFLVPAASGTSQKGSPSLLACTFVDQKFSHRVPAGGVLLRGFFGGDAAEQLTGESDSEIARLTREQLSRLLGPLPDADVTVVRRWPLSLPQYYVGHVERIAKAEMLLEELPGLRLLGNAYHGVGLPDLVRDAREAVACTRSVLEQGAAIDRR